MNSLKKYIRAVVCLIFSLIKFSFIKLYSWNSFKFSLLNIVSPFTEVEVGRNSKLVLGKLIRMKSGAKIRVRRAARMEIGDNTSLNHGCIFTAHKKILIGKDVQFGPNVQIYDHDHDFRVENGLKDQKYRTSDVLIGNNVWVGANVVILRGTKIGDNCVIGAGAIIQGEFPNNTLISSNRDLITKKIISK